MRCRFLCLLGLLWALASGGEATAAPAPSCSFPAQTGPGVRVCERTTGAQGMEPMLAVNRRGTMFMGMATDKGLYEQPGELTGTAENALLRSRNDGRTWRRIPLPGGINASEGFPYIDAATDRLFVTSLSADTTRCGQPVIYSDDEGEHWTEAAGRPGCSPPTVGDWPKIFAGPHRGGAPAGYPDAVYECNFIPNILVAASIGCWRSDDGGDHFEFAGLLPTVNGACTAGGEQGGTGATIVHGSGRVLSNGVVVVPLTVCGEPMVVRSRDEGRTWTAVSTGDDSIGLDDIVAADEGLVLGITDHVWSENLAVDAHDNLFFAYLADGGVRLATSRDGGRSWRLLGFVSPPPLRRAIVVSVVARGRGEIAMTYYGTPDKGDALGASGINWRAWMTYSSNALAAEPVFRSAPTSPASAPTMDSKMYGCCTTEQTFLEYTGVQFTARRAVRGAFTRWTGKHLPELVLAKLRLP
ncbi:MAG: repeat-like domain [Solirubrobacterales bacterium]|nr:repeat-like domain [Solirubrobacterales bacterium]